MSEKEGASMSKKFDPTQLDEMTKKFLEGGIKIAEEGEEGDKIHWAQDPEKVYRDLEKQEQEVKKSDGFSK